MVLLRWLWLLSLAGVATGFTASSRRTAAPTTPMGRDAPTMGLSAVGRAVPLLIGRAAALPRRLAPAGAILWVGLGGLRRRKLASSKKPGKLILVRHGESTWNANKTFTGWVDVDLSEQGEREVEHAARLLLERGFTVDVVYTSLLKRAIRSAWILLREWDQSFRPVKKTWRLNERMYGALQGLSKPALSEKLGEDVVFRWRAGYKSRPPPMPVSHPLSPMRERKYAEVEPHLLPLTESLADCLERTLPVWEEEIMVDLKNGMDVVVVAHGNSLRGLVKAIDKLDSRAIERVGIPNGIPLVYEFDRHPNSGALLPLRNDNSAWPLSGEFLEEKGLLRAALKRERETSALGQLSTQLDASSTVLSPIEKSLTMLNAERKLFTNKNSSALDSQDKVALLNTQTPAKQLADRHLGKRRRRRSVRPFTPGLAPPPPLLVIIRHGKTEHNKLGLFTGWEDCALAPEGRVEANEAGRLLAEHGVEIDVVYTSWLSRAIETAWIVLRQMDTQWVHMNKSWRLNERMYGALTGLSKRMIKQRHGEAQFSKWRRSYHTRPPPVSPFSRHYPGNDERYVKYAQDMPWSFLESLIRSLGHGKLEFHRRMPRSESLKDCMERTIPYFRDVILPESIELNRTVLIASSENAIRGLLMHLCEIPKEQISEIEIPTGVPLLYDLEGQCIHLLDDGQLPRPRDRYNFGKSSDLLFQPCRDKKREDGLLSEYCAPDLDTCSDPHIELDDRFFDSDDALSQPAIHFAERERNELISGFDEDEFTVERREGWGEPEPNSDTVYDDEPEEAEI